MKLDSRTYEEILAGEPECFALPHEFHFSPERCESCFTRQDCLETGAQFLHAWYVGMLKGRTGANLEYSREDERNVVPLIMREAPQRSVTRPCNPAVLPQLFERAMEDYAKRPPKPSVEELLADLGAMVEDLAVERDNSLLSPMLNLTPSGDKAHTATSSEVPASGVVKQECNGCVTAEDPSSHDQDAGWDDLVEEVQEPGRYTGTIVSPPLVLAHHARLMDELRELLGEFAASRYTDYGKIRKQFLSVNFALNEFGHWAPRFRDFPSRIADFKPVSEHYMVDRQLIDLHWFWATNQRKLCSLAGYETMLCAVPFDKDTAVRFAKEKWDWETKAGYLDLTEQQQWELSAIQSENLRKRWATIKNGDRRGKEVRQIGAVGVRRVLQEAVAPKHRRHIPAQVATWVAVRICGSRWTEAARFRALILGDRQPDPRQVQRTYEAVCKTLKKPKV